jgi:hypothetical protein
LFDREKKKTLEERAEKIEENNLPYLESMVDQFFIYQWGQK